MRALTYVLVGGVMFWCGVVHTEASRPLPPPKRVTPPAQLTPALTPICENLTEIRRACTHRARSSLIQKLNPNTKGKL